MRLNQRAAKRLAVVILALPFAGWAVFVGYKGYFTSVVVPESVEFRQVQDFVLSSSEVAREFGPVVTIKRGDRLRVRTIGTTKDGFFSFEIVGHNRSGVIDAHWIARESSAIDVTEIRKQIPWHDAVVLFKKEPSAGHSASR